MEDDDEHAMDAAMDAPPGTDIRLPSGRTAHRVRVYADGTVIASDAMLGRYLDMRGAVLPADLEAPIQLN